LEPMEIAEKYTYRYFRDMDKLRVLRPDISPRATGHIPEQIAMIRTLIQKGHAYEVDGNVYFDVGSLPDYGKLSGRNLEEAESGSRIESKSDKKNPSDFALWKKADDSHLMKWDSPWGEGFPGWHIECSAMATKYLGETIDIHGGGIENQFPHHECEIAQCEGAHDHPFVRYWMHNNMVTLNGQKMGKSLGNAISLEQFFDGSHKLLSRSWTPEVIRFFLLQSHYRSTTDFSEAALASAESGYRNLSGLLQLLHKAADDESTPAQSDSFDIETLKQDFESCMNDDFNTARAIGTLFEQLRPLKSKLSNHEIPANIKDVAGYVLSVCRDVLAIWEPSEFNAERSDLPFDQVMQLLIDLRKEAREKKDWATADAIRNRLAEAGITLEDTPDKTIYKTES
ncbi:cysteine--tRNA ligase, partial [Balneolaceae bacterium ANBcel3]|nr:cysteine--tRNA ligase [Balneolaceae bacterium ANBcel3]